MTREEQFAKYNKYLGKRSVRFWDLEGKDSDITDNKLITPAAATKLIDRPEASTEEKVVLQNYLKELGKEKKRLIGYSME